jgi:hypothetical protein
VESLPNYKKTTELAVVEEFFGAPNASSDV